MAAKLHSFGHHVSSIASSSAGHTAFALAHVFGNSWTGALTVQRAGGDVVSLPQQHGVTCVAWLGQGEATVVGNEEGDLVCTRIGDSGGVEAFQVVATANDFDAPVAGAWRLMRVMCCV